MFEKIKAQVKGILDARFPFEILASFEALDKIFVKTSADDQKFVFYENVDDKKIIFNTNVKNGIVITATLMIILIVFLIINMLYIDKREQFDNFFMGIILFISSAVLIISIIRYFIVKQKFIELNRKEGKISFQKPIGSKRYIFSFNEMEAVWQGMGGSSPDILLVLRSKKNKKIGFRSVSSISHIRRGLIRETLSFYVWYMDKNRPLPPGNAFDPFRQKDFERRKAAGFPKPLYRSHIQTPEATKEQQEEREQYWKDELEEFTREPNSVMYDPEIHKNWTKARWLEDDDSSIANTYFKFEFENGEIIYIKTDENGRGRKPPNDQKFNMTRMDLFESYF